MVNGLLFKSYHLPMILNGTKTATRRVHKRPLREGTVVRIKRDWYSFTDTRLRINRSYTQRLGDMTELDAQKEGGYTLESFKETWITINGSWDPDQMVNVYEFEVVR